MQRTALHGMRPFKKKKQQPRQNIELPGGVSLIILDYIEVVVRSTGRL